MKRRKIHFKKYHSKTRMVSVRIDEDLYNDARSKNLNLSLAINVLLRGYLYIQNNDDECPLFGSSAFCEDEVYVDVYFK